MSQVTAQLDGQGSGTGSIAGETVRRAVHVYGIVQGVGFRPFVRQLALQLGLTGFVRNRAQGVYAEVQGGKISVGLFLERLRREAPIAATVHDVQDAPLVVRAEGGFAILASEGAAGGETPSPWGVPPDRAMCPACAAEVMSLDEPRYRYPFTSCTQCGPRYSIVTRLPFDRANTAMAAFGMCDVCRGQYEAASDRRCFAQTITCADCGPQVRLLDAEGLEVATGDDALAATRRVLEAGKIVALKGIGGFQLVVDATNDAAVARLRRLKRRPHKPFAVLFADLPAVRAVCHTDAAEDALLTSAQAPIVLVRKRDAEQPLISPHAAPGTPIVGAMLPNTPLHWILARDSVKPLICTSGNLSGEPLCLDNAEALERLREVADVFLVHDRAITRPLDDSVARVGTQGIELVRRARGYAPTVIPFPHGPSVLALGGHLKNTIAVASHGQAFVSQHLGDLGSGRAREWLERTVAESLELLTVKPDVIACDLHSDYASSLVAEDLSRRWAVPLVRVQHHHAHVAACLAEWDANDSSTTERSPGAPTLGLTWDGAGMGLDGAVWGGEALVVRGARSDRAAHLRYFPLPGGERAVREPRRAAFGLLFEAGLSSHWGNLGWWSRSEVPLLVRMCERGINAPQTSSMGRLVDAVAALLGVADTPTFEAQAALELEHIASNGERAAYPFPLVPGQPAVLDWQPLVEALLADIARKVDVGVCAARFHNALVDAAEAVAKYVDTPRVVLTGGCFQNQRLRHSIAERLRSERFEALLPREFPCNDGGLALGQAYVAVLGNTHP